jgi:hypothetical protein
MAKEFVQGNLAHWNVERGETELAGEGAATGGLDVDNAVSNVFVVVEIVRENELAKVREFSVEDFCRRVVASQ